MAEEPAVVGEAVEEEGVAAVAEAVEVEVWGSFSMFGRSV